MAFKVEERSCNTQKDKKEKSKNFRKSFFFKSKFRITTIALSRFRDSGKKFERKNFSLKFDTIMYTIMIS